MREILSYLLVFITAFILLPVNAVAKTLGDLKQEYADLERQIQENASSIQKTDEEIAATKAEITRIFSRLEEASKEIKNLTNEITKLNKDILEKDNQTKELMKFFQVSEGVSTYLEYIFEADSITDFIYRVSVTEQLSAYNNKLIDEMNALIKQNNENIKKLHKEEDSLKSLQADLQKKQQELAVTRSDLVDDGATLEEDIEAAKKVLEFYESKGCTDSDSLSSCANGALPPDTGFWRPVHSAAITSEYGPRIHPIYGTYSNHSGMDLAPNGGGDLNIYPIANGHVVYADWYGGYGKAIIVVHEVNGRIYSSLYGHLSSIYVSVGDIVTKDSAIGYMGSTGNSTGTHLHLNMYEGRWPDASLTDPRYYINFPGETNILPGNWYPNFYDRTSYYD